MMNIVVVSPSWPQFSNPNGIVTYCANLVPALRKQGHRVQVVTFDSQADDNSDVHILHYTLSFWEKLWCVFREYIDPGYRQYYFGSRAIAETLVRLHRQSPIDVVEMEDSFGWHKCVQKKVTMPVVMKLHGPCFLNNFERRVSAKTAWRIRREASAFLAATFVSSPSWNILELTKARYGQRWKLSEVLVNPMRAVQSDKQWALSSVVRHQILFVGRFDDHKGGDVMLHAFFRVRAVLPDATLIFIGPDKGVQTAQGQINIEGFARRHGYSFYDGEAPIVTFMGRQDQDTIAFYRKTSHVTAVCSRYETFGNVALEAMACGSPLVCSNAGALPEVVEDEASGLLFEKANDAALSEKILQIVRSDALALRLSAGGLERAKETYSPDKVAGSVIHFFQRVIALAKS